MHSPLLLKECILHNRFCATSSPLNPTFPKKPKMNSLRKQLAALCTAAILTATSALAQNLPFPQHVSYAAGIKPSNATQAAMDTVVSNYWTAYKARYVKS